MSTKNLSWFAVYTKPRWEKKVVQSLDDAGIECYCPLNKVIKQWSDRKKVVMEPIFKSYVFVRIADKQQQNLKRINGILNFVHWLGKPAVIRDDEIVTIRKFLNEFTNVVVEGLGGLQVNNIVRVKQGLLMNYQGILVEVHGNRARVRIETLGVQLSAQFDKRNLEVVG